jgi:hypothetical protein
MSHIRQVLVTIETGDATDADANGPVYLGLGAREFRLDKEGDQFKRATTDTFLLGNGTLGTPDVLNPNENDPATPVRIEHEDIENNPYSVYIAYESDKKWLIRRAEVRAIAPADFDRKFVISSGITAPGVWLGDKYGKRLYFI